jgi:CRISPR system Cascade subunit CasE
MFLHRIHLNLRHRDARRDLADPYQLHATLSRAFSPADTPCPAGAFLWRLEPEVSPSGAARVLVQSHELPDWTRIANPNWMDQDPDPAVDLNSRLCLAALTSGRRFRFRLRANPSTSKDGRRVGLTNTEAQEAWLDRKGRGQHGFELVRLAMSNFFDEAGSRPDLRITQAQMIRGRQQSGNAIQVFAALFEGVLQVTDPDAFHSALRQGIGHGKAMGLGLLSVVPIL